MSNEYTCSQCSVVVALPNSQYPTTSTHNTISNLLSRMQAKHGLRVCGVFTESCAHGLHQNRIGGARDTHAFIRISNRTRCAQLHIALDFNLNSRPAPAPAPPRL